MHIFHLVLGAFQGFTVIIGFPPYMEESFLSLSAIAYNYMEDPSENSFILLPAAE